MLTGKKTYGKAKSMPVGIIWGTVVALAITIVYAVIISQLVLGEKIDASAIGIGSMIVLPLASAVSAITSSGMIKRRRMQVCLLSGVSYLLSLLLINLLFFGGQFGGFAATILLVAIGVIVVGMWGLKGEKRTGKKGVRWGSR